MARTLIVEADGASRGNPGPASYGALVVDAATGEVLVELAESLGVVTNNVAEYSGLIAGLRAAGALDPDAEVEVRMDSKLAVQQMSGTWQIKHPAIRALAAEARTAFPRPAAVRYTWVPRERNKRADALGNLALDDPVAAAAKTAEAKARIEAAATIAQPTWSAAPDLGPPTTLILLRHGATALTAEKRFSGAGDPELVDTGRAQAAAVARRLAARGGIDAVVASPLARTRQTAQTAADALGLPVSLDEGFRETDFGLWDGHTFGEVRERWPAEMQAWLNSPSVAPPKGESFDAVTARVLAARDSLLKHYARRTVLVVSHVTPIKTLIRDALGAPPEALYAMELSAASLSVVTYYGDGRSSLRLFNDTAHLTG
ncbi:MAG: bifunctional RNase H/acid phosphatase [Catenulisporales bacterium]|nr:bifunctional RNase H/acid phosphatase [Catenulisporales bacterium]